MGKVTSARLREIITEILQDVLNRVDWSTLSYRRIRTLCEIKLNTDLHDRASEVDEIIRSVLKTMKAAREHERDGAHQGETSGIRRSKRQIMKPKKFIIPVSSSSALKREDILSDIREINQNSAHVLQKQETLTQGGKEAQHGDVKGINQKAQKLASKEMNGASSCSSFDQPSTSYDPPSPSYDQPSTSFDQPGPSYDQPSTSRDTSTSFAVERSDSAKYSSGYKQSSSKDAYKSSAKSGRHHIKSFATKSSLPNYTSEHSHIDKPSICQDTPRSLVRDKKEPKSAATRKQISLQNVRSTGAQGSSDGSHARRSPGILGSESGSRRRSSANQSSHGSQNGTRSAAARSGSHRNETRNRSRNNTRGSDVQRQNRNPAAGNNDPNPRDNDNAAIVENDEVIAWSLHLKELGLRPRPPRNPSGTR